MIRSNQSSLDRPYFAVLSDRKKERIHLAALEILRRTGIRVFSEKAVNLLRDAGCSISEGNRVRIPSHLVEDAIRHAPRSITLYDRTGKPALRLEAQNTYYGTGSDLPTVIDPFTGERRQGRKEDTAQTARICDFLPNIDFVMSMAIPWDVPIGSSDVHSFEAMAANTTKPIVYTAHGAPGLADIIEVARAIAGGAEALRQKPFLVLYAEPSTPLQHSKEAVEKLMVIAEAGLPVTYIPGPIAGAAAPITMAGGLALANAEILSAIVIAQLMRPGAPCLFGSGAVPLDMRTAVAGDDAPEFMLTVTAMVEMGQYYGLPTWGFAGLSDSKLFDEQAAIEGALWVMTAALSGVNLAHDVGYLESARTRSFEMLVAMDEVIGMANRMLEGIKVDDETLAVDLIDEVGPGGEFLSTDHTFKHYKENWYPGLLDRRNYEDWEELGKKTLGQRANEKVRTILENHHPLPLAATTRDAVGRILTAADDRASTE